MDLPSYFGPKLTGGAHNSAGLGYQDICGLICLFESLNRDDEVLSLSIETINDFAIHQRNQTITAQVKKQTLSVTDVKKLMKQIYSDNKQIIMIIATHFHDNLNMLIKKRDQFRYAMSSDLDETLKNFIIQDFHTELVKYGMDDFQESFVKSEFRMIPERMSDMLLLATVWKWTEKKQHSVDIENFLNNLKTRMQSLRSNRGYLHLEEINELVREYSTQSIATKIIKKAYDAQFIKPSQVLSVLGETKEDILSNLEKKLLVAYNYAKEGKYPDALDIYLSLVKLYPKDDIQFQCAMLYEMIDKYEQALNYCNKILGNTPSHYDYGANLVKGTCLGALENYTEAITYLEKALSCKNTPEAHYNLGYTYWLSGDNNRNKSIHHYRSCLELDEYFVSAHLNISICYFEVMSFELSLFHVNRALQLDPSLYQAYGRKGELYRFFGLHDDAIEYFLECLSHDENNYQSLFGISFCFSEKGYLSEAIIYFNRFFNEYFHNFFLQEDPIGKKISIIDMGWKRNTYSTFQLYNKNQVNVYVNGIGLPIPLKIFDEIIFIGCIELTDVTGSMLYPTVGKIFQEETDYLQTLTQLQKAVDLFQYFDQPMYVDFNDCIQVNVRERDKYVLVEIIFNEKYQIIGMTDVKSGGLQTFIDYFEQYGQCRIHLECQATRELFIIEGIKKVDVHPSPISSG